MATSRPLTGSVLEVRSAGLLTTVQDGGRPRGAPLGVPPGGACDRWSLAVANLLLDNEPTAPAIEMTLVGPDLLVREAITVAVGGADLGGAIAETGEPLRPGVARRLPAGVTLTFPGGRSGARAYLALPGGLDVPRVLGAAATLVGAGLGGIEPFAGRPLRPGDLLRPARRGAPLDDRIWPAEPAPALTDPVTVRFVRGPDVGALGERVIDALAASTWRVGPGSDRSGLRLDGPPLTTAPVELVSRGVRWGAIQLPPDGRPIVLLPDGPTVGGYPVVGVVVSADLPLLGQLRPGDRVRCVEVPLGDAVALARARADELERARRALIADVGWDELWRSAGG